jgi:hypothetical protein
MTINRNEFVFGLGAVAALTSCSSGANTVAPVAPDPSRASGTALQPRASDHVAEDRLTDRLRAVYATPAALASRRLVGQLLIDPAVPALAKSILQTYAGSLTGFQASMLGAIGILTRDPAALNALVTGTNLTRAQRASLESIGDAASRNPAIRTVMRTAAGLSSEKNAGLLRQYVVGGFNRSLSLGGPFATLGNPMLDAIAKDVYAIANSSAFASTTAALAPIVNDPGFIDVVRRWPPEITAAYIPPSVLLALMLPVDHDPVLPSSVQAELELLIVLAVLLIGLEIFIIAAAEMFAVTAGEALFWASAALFADAIQSGIDAANAVNAWYKTIDCDHDGDPSDTNDSPGNEC